MAEPDWLIAAGAQLDRLEQPHREKKRATILALVDARLAGRSEETVWEPRRPDTCSRSIYHSKWHNDHVFSDVLEQVTILARNWQDGRALRSLHAAAERLALAAPVAVSAAISELKSEDPSIRLRAAFGILDRAGLETSSKNKTEVTGAVRTEQTIVHDLSRLSTDELKALRTIVAKAESDEAAGAG